MQLPDRGRKQSFLAQKICLKKIEKCSSPIGDGNMKTLQSNFTAVRIIEKCSSPIGDGNRALSGVITKKLGVLRIVAPR